MFDGKTTAETTTKTQSWDLNLIFSVLADPVRRGIITSLARKGPQTALDFAPVVTNRRQLIVPLNRIVKNLGTLRDAGLVIVTPHPTDGRKQVYGLNPNIVVTKTETTCGLEFGTWFVRFATNEVVKR